MKSIYGKLSRMKFEIIPQGYADVTEVTATDNNVDEGIIFVNSSGQEVTGTSTSKAEVIQLSEEISELRSQYEALQNQYNELTVRLQTVQGEYSALIEDYNSLNANYEALETQYEQLQSKKQELQNNYDELSARFTILENNYNELNETVNTANDGLESVLNGN